jgi:hypothetical protein
VDRVEERQLKAPLRRLEALNLCPHLVGIVFNEHTDEDGAVVFRHACKLGFEGIVSKRLTAPYRSGPSRDWLKVKNPNSPPMLRARPIVVTVPYVLPATDQGNSTRRRTMVLASAPNRRNWAEDAPDLHWVWLTANKRKG